MGLDARKPANLENHQMKTVLSLNYILSKLIVCVQKNLPKMTTLKKTKIVFKTNYHLMQVKVLQNAPLGAFCNNFDLH